MWYVTADSVRVAGECLLHSCFPYVLSVLTGLYCSTLILTLLMRIILTKHGDVIEQVGAAVRTLEHKADTMLRLT